MENDTIAQLSRENECCEAICRSTQMTTYIFIGVIALIVITAATKLLKKENPKSTCPSCGKAYGGSPGKCPYCGAALRWKK